MAEYHFEQNGLFLGLLSYPYYVDGKEDIYRNVINPFFEEHRKRLNKRDSDDVEKPLYKPCAYRMFGTQGLVVLSLIDDYSFCSRHFNKNHIRTLLEGRAASEDSFKFKSIVVTGVTEVKEREPFINQKASDTFLKEVDKYPFMGIIRLKIDHRILLGGGIKVIRAIKGKIHSVFKNDELYKEIINLSDVKSDYLVIDCFDNDEMTIIAFSNSVKFLIQFLGNVRNIKTDTAVDSDKEDNIVYYDKDGILRDKHIFSYTYIGFGYNVEYNLNNDDQDKSEDFLVHHENDKEITLNCLIETRPGHRDTYKHYLVNEYEHKEIIKVDEKIASGGSVLKATIKLHEIHKLEGLCKEEVTKRNVRKMRVSLQDPIKGNGPDDFSNHAENFKSEIVDKQLVVDLKKKMKSVGISKIVRDRLLALFELYDSSKRNLIQTLYFEELSGIGGIFSNIVKDFTENPNIDIKTMESILDGEITNMESACYDRIHNRKYAENLLEYSGGIQQHLTAFGYAYNKINTVISGDIDNKDTYTIITGADRVSSARTHLNLNINHILFPELFVTTAWKEASNKEIKVLGCYSYGDILKLDRFHGEDKINRTTNRFVSILNTWNDFVKNKSSFAYIKNLILQETNMLLKNDETFNGFKSIMNEELLLYFLKDYLVFHFAFQRDFEKMWYFSFKILLQTTNSYYRLGKIKRKHLIYMFLRLFMVGLRLDHLNKDDDKKEQCERFFQAQLYKPFDSVLQEYWLECFNKTYLIAKKLFDILNEYGFIEISEYQVSMCEYNAEKSKLKEKEGSLEINFDVFSKAFAENETVDLNLFVKINNECITKRENVIKKFEECFEKRVLIDNEGYNSFDFIICLLSSFVLEVYKMDLDVKDKYYPIKSVPRKDDGEIIDEWERGSAIYEELRNNMINIPCDTTGGFFLPRSKTREQYFALRTVFYRSLWNYRMKDGKVVN